MLRLLVDGAACQAGNGNGVCKTQLERSLETTSFAQIAGRLGNVTFGGGIAMSRIDCDQTFCPQECGL